MPSENKMTAQDRLEVMELIGRYQQCIDSGDADGYAANFVPDGVTEWANGRRQGRDQIRQWVHDMVGSGGGVGADPARLRHFLSMPYIWKGDDQRCSARTYMVIFAFDAEGELIANTHWTYIDDIVKHQGEWLFEKRYMQLDMRNPRSLPVNTTPFRGIGA